MTGVRRQASGAGIGLLIAPKIRMLDFVKSFFMDFYYFN